jgi:formate hydrogenlyase subunit 3/multisubunit Na+/H+ antiporter MnhD subunit
VYAVLRSKAIMDHTLPLAFTGNVLMLFWPISFVLATFFMRLLAYSSMKHMGLATGVSVSRFQNLCECSWIGQSPS